MLKKSVAAAVLSVFAATTTTFAGDASTAVPIGFSADGKQFSYIEFGTQDGSGFPYAMVKFLDVKKNVYSAAEVAVIDDAVEENLLGNIKSARAAALLKARKSMRKLGISKSNVPEILASRKLTDMSEISASKIQFSRHPIIPGLTSSRYEISLTEKPAVLSGQECFFEESPVMLKLEVKNLGSGKSVVLQDDKKLPRSRGCVTGYRIQDIVAYENGYDEVVVILNIFTHGFEGADSRTIAISGHLPQD